MTVGTVERIIDYAGDGSAVARTVPFYFLAADDLRVTRVNADASEDVLVRGVDYNVAGAGDPAGGSVTPTAPIANGTSWIIEGAMPLEQPIDYTAGDDFPAESHERGLDRAMIALQEQARSLTDFNSRALLAPRGETMGSLSAMAWATREGKLAGFDNDGNPALFAFSAPALEQIVAVLGAIVTVAGIADEVEDVAAVAGHVTTVAGIAAEITAVAGIAGNVTSVAGIAANVTTVAGISANITAVAGIAANVTIVAGAVSNINVVAADLALGGGSLIATAGSVVSAIQGLLALTPLYTNENGQGARPATKIVVRSSAGLVGLGTAANLVNGDTSTNSAALSMVFNPVAVAGHWILIDHLEAAQKLITEATWRQQGTVSHGTWQWQITEVGEWDDTAGDVVGASWQNVGGTFTLGGMATQVQNSLASNAKSTRYQRLLGISGTAGGQYVYELELKIASGLLDRKRFVTTGGLPGDRFGKTGYRDLQVDWIPRYGTPPVHAGVNRMALFMMDDDRASGMIKNRLADQHHFDFRTDRGTYGPAPKKSAKGWLFKKQMVRSQASITGIRTAAVLMRKARGNSTLYEISTTLAGEPLYLRGSDFRAGCSVRVLAPNGEIMPVFGDTSGSNTAGATFLNRGYWHLAFIETAAALGAGRLGLGGDPDLTADTTHAAMAEFAYLSLFDGQLSDAMCKAEADWLCPIMKIDRGITLRNEECTRMVDLLVLWGQSNIGGDAVMYQYPRQLLEMANIPSVLIQSSNRRDRPYMTFPAPYAAGATSLMAVPAYINPIYTQHDGRKVGPDWAIARIAHNAGRARQLCMNKVGADGTILAHPSEGGGGSTSWHPLTAWNTGMLGHALTRLYETWFWLLDQGIGFDIPAVCWGQGETTVNPANNALQTTNWGTNFLDMRTAARLYTANMLPALWILTRLRDWETGCVGDQTKTGELRTIQGGLAASDPTNIKIVSADGSGTDSWGRTIGYHLEVGGQKLHYGMALIDRIGTDQDALVPWSQW